MSAQKSLAIIAGAGPGTGAAIARLFAAKGFAVALLARTASSLSDIEAEITSSGGTAASFPVDLTDNAALTSTFSAIKEKFPDSPLKVAVFNLSMKFAVKPFFELSSDEFKSVVNGHVGAAFDFSHLALEELVKASGGTLIFSSTGFAVKGSANVAVFSSASFAVRGLSKSLVREFQPKGIHVAHVVIDGAIDTKKTTELIGNSGSAANLERLSPDEIAKAYLYLHEQAPSAWTQELDLRPAKYGF